MSATAPFVEVYGIRSLKDANRFLSACVDIGFTPVALFSTGFRSCVVVDVTGRHHLFMRWRGGRSGPDWTRLPALWSRSLRGRAMRAVKLSLADPRVSMMRVRLPAKKVAAAS